MKIAVLWRGLSGYLNACLKSLAAIPGNELFVSRSVPHSSAPYSQDQFGWISEQYVFKGPPNEKLLLWRLERFQPDVLIVASWSIAAYRHICLKFKGRAVRVCCMDNQWRGRPKQWLGILTAPIFVRRLFDFAFVAGERQADFARRLGFDEDRIWRGFLSCDYQEFNRHYLGAGDSRAGRKTFLYVGRLAPEKGVRVLLQGYDKYRASCSEPWELRIAGTGPLQPAIERDPNINYLGFVQPKNISELFGQAGCFVIPSRFEPWGVVIHEATAAGLPIICTPECGASVHLVQNGYNGILIEKDKPASLAAAMTRISSLSSGALGRMSAASAALSMQFTPERWAKTVTERTRELLDQNLS